MKLVWCPETASKAYIDGVKTLADRDLAGTEVAELVSAMAGGWKAQLVVEAPHFADCLLGAATTLSLAAAARHTRGRYACVLPDESSAAAYASAMKALGAAAAAAVIESVVIGDAEEAMRGLQGVDLLVIDGRRRDAAAVLRAARPGPRGMVVVRHSVGKRRSAMAIAAAMGAGTRVVRAVYLPIGKGMEVVHVGVGKGPSLGRSGHTSRWIRHVDHDTGEEHVFRR